MCSQTFQLKVFNNSPGTCSNDTERHYVLYYINTNETPVELLHEKMIITFTSRNNLLSSQVKHHCCYCYIINCAFCFWYFISVYIINGALRGCLGIQNFPSFVEKCFMGERSKLVKYMYFSTLKINFSLQTCNILYIILSCTVHCETIKEALNHFRGFQNSGKFFFILIFTNLVSTCPKSNNFKIYNGTVFLTGDFVSRMLVPVILTN